jgi:integrase
MPDYDSWESEHMAKIIERPGMAKPFLARWWNPKQHQRGFATREDAELFLADLGPVEDSSGETFREYATRWIEQTNETKAIQTRVIIERIFRVHIFPVFGDVPLDKITREMCKDFLLGPTLTRSVAAYCLAELGTVLNEAVRDKRIPENPARGIKVAYNRSRAELVPVTYEQLEIIDGDLPTGWRLALWFMLGCGLRISEALAVHTRGIREGGTVLRVEEQVLNYRKPGDPIIVPLKARKVGEFRDIPLPTWLLDKIEAHIAEFGDGYLFADFTSGAKSVSNFRSTFNRGKAKAGVPKLHPHNLRHRYASVMLSAGIPVSDVSRFLGHRDINLTIGTYGHMMPSSSVRAREASDNAMQAFKQAA